MEESKKQEEFYNLLRKRIIETTSFPTNYMYKFIIPNKQNLVSELYSVFYNLNAKINTKKSSKSTYISFSVEINVDNVETIISLYKEAGKIEGIISL